MRPFFRDVRASSIQDVLRYRDPKISVFVFACALILWYFLLHGTENYLGTTSRLLNFCLLVGFFDRLGFVDFSFQHVEKRVDWLCSSLKRGIRKILPALRWERPASSAVVFLVAFALHLFAPFCSYSNAALVLILVLFSVPCLYYKKKDAIEKQLKKANKAANNAISSGRNAAGGAKNIVQDASGAVKAGAAEIAKGVNAHTSAALEQGTKKAEAVKEKVMDGTGKMGDALSPEKSRSLSLGEKDDFLDEVQSKANAAKKKLKKAGNAAREKGDDLLSEVQSKASKAKKEVSKKKADIESSGYFDEEPNEKAKGFC